MTLALLIAVAGGGGSSLRYLVDYAVTTALTHDKPHARHLPWATLLINVTGSLALGALTAAATTGAVGDNVRLVLGVGICGGYTTFSTAMVDTLRLGLQDRPGWSAANLLVTICATTAAAGLGWGLVA